ncbi:MAG: hypothetical protein WCX71_03485 [Candidatus Buchananbacteria bacterium]
MDRRKKIIIGIIGLAVVLLLILIVWLWFRFRGGVANQPSVNANVGLQIPAGLPSASAPLPQVPAGPVKEAKTEASIKAVAMTFTERYGSFSNQGNYANLDSMPNLLTAKMKAEIEQTKIAASHDSNQTYYGITTKALSVDIKIYDQTLGRAELVVLTQRQEARGDTINATSYFQDLVLTMVKTKDSWQIDSASWGGRK